MRMSRRWLLLAALPILGGLSALVLAPCGRAPAPPLAPGIGLLRLVEVQALAAVGGPAAGSAQRLERAIGRHGSLAGVLAGMAGLPAAHLEPWVRALATVVDLRRLQPVDRLILERDRPGEVRRLELVRGPGERYEAVLSGRGPVGRRIPVASERWVRRLGGEITTSFYDAVLGAGGDGELAARVADLLAADVDFLTDPRPGDRFDLLIEEGQVAGQRFGDPAILLARYAGERVRQVAYRFAGRDDRPGYYDASGSSLRKTFLKSPLNYRRVSSHFSRRRFHPIHRSYRPHLGVDFAAPAGTPVVVVGDGRVSFAGRKGENGNLVVVRHANGVETYYLHLQRIAAGVRNGARVAQGQVIGTLGATGTATGPHLDFRVKERGRFLDPLRLTQPPGPPIEAAVRPAFAAERARLDAWLGLLAPGEARPGPELVRLTAAR